MKQTKTFFESTGLVLRKIANVIWFFFPIIVIILFSILAALLAPDYSNIPPVKIVSDNCSIIDYYSSLDETTCELEITFDQTVYSGDVSIAFYDKKGNELEKLTTYMSTENYALYGTKLVSGLIWVDGKVDSYRIVDYSDIDSAEYNNDNYYYTIEIISIIIAIWMIFRGIYVIPLTISALFFSCKTYRVGEHVIVVYAGRMKHYIKIDGRKYDEKNALISFSAIKLNATMETGEQIEVYIPSFTKRISLRVNGVLETPTTF